MGQISLSETSRARPRRPTVRIVLNGAIRRVAVAAALVVVPAMIDQPLSSYAMAQEAAGSIDLNGAWQFEDVVVRVRHDGTTVRADFIDGAKCFDGQVRPYFLEGQLSGTALTGRMMACSGSPRLVQECPLSSMYETTFEVTVEAGRMAGTRVAQGIALDERNGRHTNCRLDSSYDEIRAFEGTRWCGDEERRVAEGRADLEARAAESNALAERISATPDVGNWTEEGYSGPGADLAAEFHAMDRAMLESLKRLQAAEAALERCRSGTTP